jgi:ribosomal protein L7/L12
LVERAPTVVKAGIKKEEMEELQAKLIGLGCEVEVK